MGYYLFSPFVMNHGSLRVKLELSLSLPFLFCCQFLCIFIKHDDFDLFILLGWTCTHFMFSFRIVHWLALKFAFFNHHYQSLNWRSNWPTIFLRFEIDWAWELNLTLISFRNLSIVWFCCSIMVWVKFLRLWNASSYGLTCEWF